MRLMLSAAFAASMLPALAAAQSYNPTTVTPFSFNQATYTQNFDTLQSTGTTGSTLPAGFQIVESGTNANGTYGISDGSGGTFAGNSYSFGSATTNTSDRALGSVASGSLAPIEYGAIFTNALGATITGLTFSYTGEQWRLNNTPNDMLTFQYRIGATSIGTGMGLNEAGWVTVSDLNFTAPIVNTTSTGSALDGNAAANRTARSATISGLSLGNGATFGFRWVDLDSTGTDDGLAVDDLSIRAITAVTSAVPEPASWAMMIGGFALAGAALRRRRASAALAVA